MPRCLIAILPPLPPDFNVDMCLSPYQGGGVLPEKNSQVGMSAMQANIELGGQGGRHSVSSKASIDIIIKKNKSSLFNLRIFFRHLSKIHALQAMMSIKLVHGIPNKFGGPLEVSHRVRAVARQNVLEL